MIEFAISPTLFLTSFICCLMTFAVYVTPNQSLSQIDVTRQFENRPSLKIAQNSTESLTFQVGGTQSSRKLKNSLLSLPSFLGRPRNRVQCQASLYGRPIYESCATAWEDMPDENNLETFGNRGNADHNVTLPFRFISRKSNLFTYHLG